MCGICGYISSNRIEDNVLRKMNDTMYHRGPDDAGVWSAQTTDYAVGLAQRRLSIMDLTPLGHQPMFSKDQGCVVVYNGEIYNYRELKKELEQKGHIFQSECDTEIIIEGYREWGDSVLSKLNGMFAIAIYDRAQDRVLMARDRIGKKPFYYYWDEKTFIFGSELKPIMMYPEFQHRVRTDVIARYLCTNYINEPDTIFEKVYKLESGGFLIWEKGTLRKGKYWNLLKEYELNSSKEQKDYNKCKEHLKELLKDSTQRRMIADVPTGTLLSGGIDSSLVTAMACQCTNDKVKSYSIGFKEKEYNEAEDAQKIADYLGTEHTELYIDEKSIAEMLDNLPYYYDEPFADSSQLCTMLVSELAKKDITVALSGDGGDELFCGYELYDSLQKRQKTDRFANLLYDIGHLPGIKQLDILGKLPENVQGVIDNRAKGTKVQFHLTKAEKKVLPLIKGQSLSVKNNLETELPHEDWKVTGMLLDMCSYLPNEILTKVDRASMKYALETRSPILDHRIIEYSFQIPQNFKYQNGIKKYILKDIAYELIPKELLDRPKKGFSVPVAKWMRGGNLKQQLMYFSSREFLQKQDIFVPDSMETFIKSFLEGGEDTYANIVWAFYVFQNWYEYYIIKEWHA